MPDGLVTLTQINQDDLVAALGWQATPSLAFLGRLVFAGAARKFARQMLRFDEMIGDYDIVAAARATERLYARSLVVFGGDCVPRGPVLFVSNHPGVTDTLAVLAALDRKDLLVIALDRPFLVALPNLAKHLAFVTDRTDERSGLIRKVANHLRSGGAVLTFPAGRNELDPDIYPTAADSLPDWVNSTDAFARLAPGTAVVPTCVRGVLSRRIANSRLVRLRGSSDDRLLMASALQLLGNVSLGLLTAKIQIQFGEPIRATGRTDGDQRQTHAVALGEMRRLINEAPRVRGVELM